EALPVMRRIADIPEVLPLAMVAPIARSRLAARPASFAIIAALGLLCCAALTWGYFARSAQSERAKANLETASKLTHIAESISMTPREGYETLPQLQQLSGNLEPPK